MRARRVYAHPERDDEESGRERESGHASATRPFLLSLSLSLPLCSCLSRFGAAAASLCARIPMAPPRACLTRILHAHVRREEAHGTRRRGRGLELGLSREVGGGKLLYQQGKREKKEGMHVPNVERW